MSINLAKGQRIALEKETGRSLNKVTMGLGWDAKKSGGLLGGLLGKSKGSIDLDASCLLFDEQKNLIDTVWFRQLKSKEGSIVHTGDNRTGEGEGDDEQIKVDLSRVPATVKSLIFTINSFTGQTFDQVENAFCRMVDDNTGQEIARFDLSCQGKHTAQIMIKVYRHNGEWKMHAVGENVQGRTFHDLLPTLQTHL
jgi:tellurium resistance protein TerZ